MRLGVFGQERGEISAFLYGKNAEKNAEEMLRKCGWEYSDRNAEKSPRSYMEKNAEEMRMGVFGLEYGEISALYPHFSHNTKITWRIFPHSQFSASQP